MRRTPLQSRTRLQRKTRINPKRKTPRVIHPERSDTFHKRVRLYGEARSKRRAEVFARAKGRCEEQVKVKLFEGVVVEAFEIRRCHRRATQWSHMKHGARKCDCLDPNCNIASCDECHDKRHNAGGKPCPKAEWRKA